MLKRLAMLTAALTLSLLVSCGKYYGGQTISVKSPDGKIAASFELKEMPPPYPMGENMYFTVSYNGKQLLKESPLGLAFNDNSTVMSNLLVTKVEQASGTDQFDTPLSKQATVSAEYSQVTISLREKKIPAKTLKMIFRAYNDGLAFRYEFPEQVPNVKFPSAGHEGFLKKFILINELTSYVFAEDVSAYALFVKTLMQQNYEAHYNPIKISEITRDSTVALPLLAQYEGGPAVCFTEAALTDYSAQYLTGARDMPNTLVSVLVPMKGEKESKVAGEVPFKTPWRVMMIADNAGKLIESNLILCLNEPSKIQDVSWIKPGKAAWDWWNGQVVDIKRGKPVQGGCNNDTYKYFVDFAAEAGLQYFLVDAGWYGADQDTSADITQGVTGVDIPELVKYADSKGIKILLWLNWVNLNAQMDKAFPLYETWGVAGVKIDYMNRDDAETVKFYQTVLENAAAHRLLVDFHGAYKPTGIRRTWPNLITREGVLGLEYEKWSDLCDPEHEVTIPYTRMLVGPMDFTPGSFNNATQKGFKPQMVNPMSQGTRCHQIAMFVVYESPLQVLVDSPVNYRKAVGLDFLSLVPTTWDQTKFLQGEVANYIVIARKRGDNWYLGAMTDWDAREVQVPLSDFLGGGNWKVRSWADGAKADSKPTEATFSEQQIAGDATLSIKMAPGGGYAAVFEPVR